VWITEHLFGSDLYFGKVYEGVWVPMRQMPAPGPVDFVLKSQCRSAVIMWQNGDYRGVSRMMADAAARG
jgi:hypothetical protein